MSKALHKYIYALFLFITLCCTSNRVLASHAMGTDLTYRWLGGDQYEVTLTFYRDCIGVNAPNNPVINVTSQTCAQTFSMTLNPIPGTGQDVTPICLSMATTCHGGSFTGIQEWIYKGTVTLPMKCTDWMFSYSLCCRNAAITTISNPGTSQIFVYATLNNLSFTGNNSPVFSNKPVPFICVGQPYCFNHGALDSDGDSVVYSLIKPKMSSATAVNYVGSYSAYQPLISVPAVTFDSLNGDICMTPQQLEVTVMAVLVKEYRNGVLIGTVERDMQITVMNCNNNLPWLSGINGTNVFDMTVCAGVPFCFDILSNDIDNGQALSLSWNNGIPAGTFTSAGNPHPTGKFCWTPTAADIRNNPYCFTVTVKDDACPYNGSQVFSYCINVQGVSVNLGPDQQISCMDLATVFATVATPNAVTYQWSNGATTSYITVDAGTYWCTVTSGSCSATDTVVITSPFRPSAAFTHDIPSCPDNIVNFTDQSTSFGSTIYEWKWKFGDGGTSMDQNPFHQYGPGTYIVQLNVMNTLGCQDSITDTIVVLPPPMVAYTWANACERDTVFFTDQSTGITSWNWNFGDGQSSTSQNPYHVYTTPGTKTVILIGGNSLGCTDTVSHSITVFPRPNANFTNGPVCINSAIGFTDMSSGSPTSWKWKFGDGDSSSSQNPTHVYDSIGNYNVTLVVSSVNGCLDTVVKPITVHPLPTANAGPVISICSGTNGVLVASGGVTYVWTPGGVSNDSLVVNLTSPASYTVTVTDANGCSATDTTSVNIYPVPVANAGADTAICRGSSAMLKASGGVTYVWSTGATTSSINVAPTNTTSYTVTITDSNGCTASDNVTVTVNNLPVVTLANQTICPGDTVVLDPGAVGTIYNWSTGATTQSVGVTGTGTYTVTVTNAFGCTASATATVTPGVNVTVNINDVAICQGQTAVLNAGNPGGVYHWSPNGETTQTITVGTTGVYGVTVTGVGCKASDSAAVTVNPLPIANAGADQDICTGASAILSASGGSIYIWSTGSTTSSISVTPGGTSTYTVTVTDANGCSFADNVQVIVHAPPVVSLSNQTICFPDTVLLDPGAVGTSYTWSTGATTQSIDVTNTGSYSVTVTNAFGCSSSASANVTPGVVVPITINDAAICQGQTTVLDAGHPGNTYKWSPNGETTQTITVGTAGVYGVVISGAIGCKTGDSAAVTVNPLPVATAGVDKDICSGSSTTLTASGGITFSWSTGATTSSINVNPSSTAAYTVTVTDINGCSASDNVNVTVHNSPVINLSNAGLCPGDTATLNPNVTGSTYAWSTGETTQTIRVASTGTYSVTITDSFGCSSSASANVTPGTVASINLSNLPICQGQTAVLDAGNSGTAYVWSPNGETTQTISVSSSGIYGVTVTSGSGCTATDSVNITVYPLPVVNAGVDQDICNGSSATLTASGGVNYSWSNGGTSFSINVNPGTTTTYTVNVTDTNGCSASDNVKVTVHNLPVVSLSNTTLCAGDTAVLNTGIAGATYAWSTGATTSAITVSSPGSYSVTVTDSWGCSSSSISTITPGTVVPVIINDVSICQGQTTILDAGHPGNTYVWSTGQTTQAVTVSTSGVYSIVVSGAIGCKTGDSATVTVNPLPVPNAGVDQDICNGSSAILTASGGVNYAWSTGGTTSSITVNPSSSATYTVNVTDVNGCSASDNVTITVHNLPVISLPNITLCSTDTTTLNTGVSGATYAWSTGETNSSIMVIGAGSYSVTVTDTYGCSSTASCTLTPGTPVTINLSDVTICQGQTTVLDASNPGSSYLWSPNGETTQTITVGVSGKYGVTVMGGAGCNASDSATVTVRPLPIADAGTDQSICSGSSVTLTASGGSLYQWSPGASTNQSIIVSPSGSTKYYVTVTDGFGCQSNDSVNITVNANPVVSFTPVLICSGSTTLDAGNPGSTYLWSPGGETSRTISVSTAGTYTVVVTNASSCSSTAQAIVTTGSTITANPVTINLCSGQSTVIDAGNPGLNYLWSTGSTTQTISVNSPGTYSVTVTDGSGCSSMIVNSVTVSPLPVANFISPSNCLAGATQFTDQSTVSSGSITSWNWTFGDGQTSNQQNPNYLYASAGTYSVTLHITTNSGCQASLSHTTTIYPLPFAGFSGTAVCAGTSEAFNDLSTVSSGAITNWSWNFGDGNNGIGKNATHIYSVAGKYNVTLQVTSDHGCSNTVTDSLTIHPVPSPVITASNVCQGLPTLFSNTGDSASAVTASVWSFGDGVTAGGLSASHIYSGAGYYYVTVQTSNQYGCTRTATANAQVYPLPNANFNTLNGCKNVQVTFTNKSNIDGGNTPNSGLSYSWDFGDQLGHSAQADPSYLYPFEGTFNVVLVTVSDHGCTDTITKPITIYPVPAVVVNGIATGCEPLTSALTDSSRINSGSIEGWLWDFGDGHVSTDQYPDHVYDHAGNYTVTLTVSSDHGCVATATGTEQMIVLPSAKAAFIMTPNSLDINNPMVQFTNLSSDYNSISWDFGDGGTSTEFSPSHMYKDIGNYTITLTTNNVYNCPSTAMRRMDVNPQSTLFAPNAFTPNADGNNDVWQPKYTDMTNIRVWIFNRWGEMLTKWDALDGYWDGMYQGRPVQQDVYVYQIEGTGEDGKLYKWTGDITVVR